MWDRDRNEDVLNLISDWTEAGMGGVPEPPEDDIGANSDSSRVRVLALWSSLRMARALSEFCDSGLATLSHFDFEVYPACIVDDRANLDRPDAFGAVLLAFSSEDLLYSGLEEWIRAWAREKNGKGERPLIICREWVLDGTAKLPGLCQWRSLMDELTNTCGADVIWDARS